jgi:hypothetical protein
MMASRSWFFATGGQQHGPYSEDQLRDLIGKGHIRPDTYVWSEGMAGWQFASDIPGLLSGGARPPAFPVSGTSPAHFAGTGLLAFEGGTWALLGRTLLVALGNLLVIPAPWVVTGFYRWFVSQLRVPQRPNLGFTGQPGDIWYVFVLLALCGYAGLSGVPYLQYILVPVQGYLSWMTARWFVANISSNGQRLPLTFAGEPLIYVGWYVLGVVSIVTIIGWAWVMAAFLRWVCHNIAGTRREITFVAGGWPLLWRTILFALGSMLVIPIPWVLNWYTRWIVSQFELVERTA